MNSNSRSARASKTFPIFASGSSTRTASARSRSWSPVPTSASSATSRASWRREMQRIPLIANVATARPLDRPELRISRARISPPISASRPRRYRETIRVATIGDIGANLAKFDVGDRQVPIRVQLDEQRARRPCRCWSCCKVATAAGAAVPLSAVAELRARAGPDRHRPLRPRAAGRRSTPTWSATSRSARRSSA